MDAVMRSPSVAREVRSGTIVDTLRAGADVRYTFQVPGGSLSLTAELSAGREESDDVFTQLYQAEYLSGRRQYGVSVQYRRFRQDIGGMPGMAMGRVDASAIVDLAWYFRNDLSGSYLHSLRLNVERQFERMDGGQGTVVTIQYYFYW